MRNVGAIVAGLATLDPAYQDSDKNLKISNTEEGEVQSTRWPPLPNIAQTIDQMQGGCDGYACKLGHVQHPFFCLNCRFTRCVVRLLVQARDSTPALRSIPHRYGSAASPRPIAPIRNLVYYATAAR
jgi:hypothetical protein